MTEWFKDAIIYHLLIDRFSRGKHEDGTEVSHTDPVFCGGNLQGILDRLDYLKELGINTLWLSPFNTTSAYHGYHVTDYFSVEERFGSVETLKQVVHEAHRRDIRIVMDFVPNHMSDKHPYFIDAQTNENSVYRDWFQFERWPDSYICFGGFRDVPKINLDNVAARDYIVNSAKHWLSLGIDGIRLDRVLELKHSFLQHFRRKITDAHPGTVIVGEAWTPEVKFSDLKESKMKGKYLKWLLGTTHDDLLKEYIGELDGILDFTFQRLVNTFITKPSLLRPRWLLAWKLRRHYRKFPKEYHLISFLDNHDMNRFLFDAGQDPNKLKDAALIQFSQAHPLIIYYGTEVGVSHDESVYSREHYGDVISRGMMEWDEDKQDRGLLTSYRRLIHERRSFGIESIARRARSWADQIPDGVDAVQTNE